MLALHASFQFFSHLILKLIVDLIFLFAPPHRYLSISIFPCYFVCVFVILLLIYLFVFFFTSLWIVCVSLKLQYVTLIFLFISTIMSLKSSGFLPIMFFMYL